MTIRRVLVDGDPGLRTSAITVSDQPGWREDARDLLETLTDLKSREGFGRGLAAPQIGSPFRLIAFDCAIGRFVAVNPSLTWISDEQQQVLDDCFSVPGLRCLVMRALSVSFTCLDLDGNRRSFVRLSADLSELVQHELDHLDGVLMTDRSLQQPPGGSRLRMN